MRSLVLRRWCRPAAASSAASPARSSVSSVASCERARHPGRARAARHRGGGHHLHAHSRTPCTAVRPAHGDHRSIDMNVEPGHVYMFVYTANDPVSVALAMSIARNHMEVLASSTSYDYSSGIYVTGSRFRGALAGQPYRSWDVAVLEATSRGVPGVTASSNLDIDASELEGGEVYSSLRALFTSTAGAVSRASRTATAVTDTLSGGGPGPGAG